ncbi:MAG: thioredoxin domain-containing protein [Alphaproteobacteria bacterium]|nr:thioredoxin domain-containing protein [Alphaproteobacteria bacterium]
MKKAGSFIVLIVLALALGVLTYMATHPPVKPAPQNTAATPETTQETAMARQEEPATGSTEEVLNAVAQINNLEKPDIALDTPQAPTTSETDEQDVTAEAPPPVQEETAEAAVNAIAPKTSPPPAAVESANADINVPAMMVDRVLGDPKAPVTIVEYASLTCPHCAHFANTILKDVKTQLIETGKAKLIFRDFPIDRYAMYAAKLARCAPEDKFYSLIEVFFRSQERWTKNEDPLKALKQYGALAGMSGARMEACLASEELENYISLGVSEAQRKYAIRSTPTFVFNFGEETLAGAQPVEKFVEVTERLTQAAQQ